VSTNIGKARVHHPLKSYALAGGSKCLCENSLYHLAEPLTTSTNHLGQRKSSNRFVFKHGLVPAFRLYGSEGSNCCESEREMACRLLVRPTHHTEADAPKEGRDVRLFGSWLCARDARNGDGRSHLASAKSTEERRALRGRYHRAGADSARRRRRVIKGSRVPRSLDLWSIGSRTVVALTQMRRCVLHT
jgi:hypothetical protein